MKMRRTNSPKFSQKKIRCAKKPLPSVRQNRAHHLGFLWFNLLEKVLEKGFFGQWVEPAARVASLEKNPFSNFKIPRKKYSLEKQLKINHTAGSNLPNAGEWVGGENTGLPLHSYRQSDTRRALPIPTAS